MKTRDAIHLPPSYIDRIVKSITEAVPTDSVYLFGSYARGEETPDSDIDLYVITSDDKERPLRYGSLIRQALLWMDRPKDVLTETKRRFEALSHELWNVEHAVKEEGVILYAAS